MQPLIVSISAAPNEDLIGPVTFKHPTIYDSLAIGRRAVQLSNLGVPDGQPRIAVQELPYSYQEVVYLIATLEHVIHTAPKGFYRADQNSHPVLDLGQFDSDEAFVSGSFLWVLYSAYLRWRSDFRANRNADTG
jgi:hypothetical protein